MAKNERVLYENIYEQALDRFQQRDYQGTMDLLADVGQWPLVWLRPFLLRAYALRGLGCYVQEMMALQDLLQVSERIEVRSASDTAMIAEAWSLLGEALVNLGDCRLAVEAFLQSASLEVDIPKGGRNTAMPFLRLIIAVIFPRKNGWSCMMDIEHCFRI